MSRKLKLDFAPEWLALVALALLDLGWARAIGLHISVGWGDGKLVTFGLVVMLLVRIFWRRGGMMAEYFSLPAAATITFGVLSYLCVASSGPLADNVLEAADRALLFDWMAGYQYLLTHPLPQ